MLQQLSVTNFKSWKQIDEMRLAPITGLFGTNSSGKTSILQLLLMLRQTAESTDRSLVLDMGAERSLVQLGSFKELIFNHDLDSQFSFRMKWQLPEKVTIQAPEDPQQTLFSGETMSVESYISAHQEKPLVDKLAYSLGESRFEMKRKSDSPTKFKLESVAAGFSFIRTTGRVWDLPVPVKCYGFPDQVFSYFQNASFLSDLQLEFEQFFDRLFYLGPLREFPKRYYQWTGADPTDMGQRGERAVDALLAAQERGKYLSPGHRLRKRTLDEQVAHWLKELGLIHSFNVERISKDSNLYQVRVKKSEKSPDVLITDVGFGVSQILPVLVLCYYVPEGSILVLEQPEIHLHPSVQSGLADVFIDAMKTRNIQIIIESHSEHLLRRLQRRIAEEQLATEQVAIYFCDTEKGRSTLSELEMDVFGNIKNWPKNFFGDEFGELAAITEAAMKRKSEESK